MSWDHLYAKTGNHLFSIATWGASGSTWLAKTLNAHPEVYCQHAINNPWSKLTKSKRLDGLHYLSILGQSGSTYTIAGDVHGISYKNIPQIKSILKDKYSPAVIVREPIARIQSNLVLAENANFYKGWNFRYLLKKILQHKLKLQHSLTLGENKQKSLMFIHIAFLLNLIIEEKKLGCPIFTMEKFTSDGKYLSEIFETISNGKLNIDPEWSNQIVQLRKVGSHLKQAKPELQEWQIEILRKVVKRKAWELYEDLGYQIPSFID